MTNQIPDEHAAFLRPARFIDSDHASIRSLAAELTGKDDSPRTRAVRIFGFVRDRIRYNPFSPMMDEKDYLASTVLARGFGFCVQKAVLLAALSRAAGVPCRLCFADIRNHIVPGDLAELMGTDLFTYHGYGEFFLYGKWLKATPAFDLAMCQKHGIVPVEFDGTADAVFHPANVAGQKHIEYVRQIGCYADVPFADVVRAFEEVYVRNNPRLRELWKGKQG